MFLRVFAALKIRKKHAYNNRCILTASVIKRLISLIIVIWLALQRASNSRFSMELTSKLTTAFKSYLTKTTGGYLFLSSAKS